ncbi:hypothetical protein BKFM_00851 [Borrelia sp. HM]|nr:hypothetical protein BKFM_00851 [Borrelia sp. HM]
MPKSSLKQTLEVAKGNNNSNIITSPEQILPKRQQPVGTLEINKINKTNQQVVTQKGNVTSSVENNNGNSENQLNVISQTGTGSISIESNEKILPPPQSPSLNLSNNNNLDLDAWSKTFFEQCTTHQLSDCNKPSYIYSNDKFLVDKNEIINEFIRQINMSVEYKIDWSGEENYNTKEKAIQMLKQDINQILLVNSSKEGSIQNHKFNPENYPGVSIKQFLHDKVKIYTDFTGMSEQVLYSALNYDKNYIYPLIKAMGKVLKEWSDHNEAKQVCQALLKSIAWMSAKTHIYIYRWANNDDNILDKLTRKEIIDLTAGLIIQWTRRNSVLYGITQKHISFLFSKGASAQEFLNLFKVFNKPGSTWNNEFKRRDIENEYLISRYYR